jgi:hypothetical protein
MALRLAKTKASSKFGLSVQESLTFTATAPTVLENEVELVAAKADRFLGIQCRKTLPSHYVFDISNRLKMAWIDTGTDTAEMIDRESFRYRTNGELVAFAVHSSNNSFFVFSAINGITVSIQSPKPKPTAGIGFGYNARVEQFSRGMSSYIHARRITTFLAERQ